MLLIPVFAVIYSLNPQFWSEPLTFIQSIYFSVVTVTTLGYGDIVPITDAARILTAIESIIGIVIIGIFINAVARFGDHVRERKRKEILRDHMLDQYSLFREDTIPLCLEAISEEKGTRFDNETEKKLKNFMKFREFISGENRQHIYDLANGIQNNETILEDIFVQCEMFAQQINFALSNMLVEDKEALGVLTRVAQRPALVRHWCKTSGDPAKYVTQYLIELLAMKGPASGPMDYDFIEKAIRSL